MRSLKMTKTCSKEGCNNSNIEQGRTICRDCRKLQQRTHAKQVRAKDPDKYNKLMREYNKKNYFRQRLYRYGLLPEEYDQMLYNQDSKCAICGKPPKGKYPLAIDHHHKTGKVRGLLCFGCNRAIAILDNPELLNKANAYLK